MSLFKIREPVVSLLGKISIMVKTNIVLTGLGYWGNNFRRIVESKSDELNIVAIIDANIIKNESIPTFQSIDHFLKSQITADATIICTPSESHYELTKKFLQNNIHCLVEKPFTLSKKQSHELYGIAEEKDLTVLVDHTFLYDSSIKHIIEIIKNGDIGEVMHISFERSNLGPIRTDVNSAWDLSTHDVSILLSIFDGMPDKVSAEGVAIVNENIEDIVNTNLKFNNTFITMFASWLHPEKTREIKFVGTNKMIVWNGMSQDQEIRIYDKGYEHIPTENDLYSNLISIRNGDLFIPQIKKKEPLREVVNDFQSRINGQILNKLNTKDLTMRVVEVMESINSKL